MRKADCATLFPRPSITANPPWLFRTPFLRHTCYSEIEEYARMKSLKIRPKSCSIDCRKYTAAITITDEEFKPPE